MKTLKLIRTARHHICMIYEQGKHFVCLGDKWITIYRALEKNSPYYTVRGDGNYNWLAIHM